MLDSLMLRTVTKSIELPIPSAQAHAYVQDVTRWPTFCVQSIRSVKRLSEHNYTVVTQRSGEGRVVMHPEPRFGILDHDYHDGAGNHWWVACRVTDTFLGSVLVKTLCQPRAMPDTSFDAILRVVEEEMQMLRRVLPRAPASA